MEGWSTLKNPFLSPFRFIIYFFNLFPNKEHHTLEFSLLHFPFLSLPIHIFLANFLTRLFSQLYFFSLFQFNSFPFLIRSFLCISFYLETLYNVITSKSREEIEGGEKSNSIISQLIQSVPSFSSYTNYE